jgi:drug/metabolite transporter (DMT)-like permease
VAGLCRRGRYYLCQFADSAASKASKPEQVGIKHMIQRLRHILHTAPKFWGVVLALGYTLAYSFYAVLVKMASTQHHIVEIVFYRNLVSLIVIALIWAIIGNIHRLRRANITAQLTRGLLGTITMALTFASFAWLTISEAQALRYCAPLFVVVLSYPLLKEKVGLYRTGAAIGGFAGLLLMTQPGVISSLTGGLFGIGAALGHGLVLLTLRWMGRNEDVMVTVTWFAAIGLCVAASVMPFFAQMPDLSGIVLLCGVGIMGVLIQLFLTQAYFLAPAAMIAPMLYLNLVWAIGIDLLIWGDLPNIGVFAGAAIIIGANLAIVWRERRVAAAPKD